MTKKRPVCLYSLIKCPNREEQDGSCLLRNPFKCPIKEGGMTLEDLGFTEGKMGKEVEVEMEKQGINAGYEQAIADWGIE